MLFVKKKTKYFIAYLTALNKCVRLRSCQKTLYKKTNIEGNNFIVLPILQKSKLRFKTLTNSLEERLFFSNKSNNLQVLIEKFTSNIYRKSLNPNPNDFFEGYLY